MSDAPIVDWKLHKHVAEVDRPRVEEMVRNLGTQSVVPYAANVACLERLLAKANESSDATPKEVLGECGRCVHFELGSGPLGDFEGTGRGRCRRYLPREVTDHGRRLSLYPEVSSNGKCEYGSEFEEKVGAACCYPGDIGVLLGQLVKAGDIRLDIRTSGSRYLDARSGTSFRKQDASVRRDGDMYALSVVGPDGEAVDIVSVTTTMNGLLMKVACTSPGPGSIVCCGCGNEVNAMMRVIPGTKPNGEVCDHGGKTRFVPRSIRITMILARANEPLSAEALRGVESASLNNYAITGPDGTRIGLMDIVWFNESTQDLRGSGTISSELGDEVFAGPYPAQAEVSLGYRDYDSLDGIRFRPWVSDNSTRMYGLYLQHSPTSALRGQDLNGYDVQVEWDKLPAQERAAWWAAYSARHDAAESMDAYGRALGASPNVFSWDAAHVSLQSAWRRMVDAVRELPDA